MATGCVIGVDLGGTKLLAGAVDRELNVHHRATRPAHAVDHRAVIERGLDRALAPTQRIFLYLPFEHAEDIGAQDLSVALFEGLRDGQTFKAAVEAPADATPIQRLAAYTGRTNQEQP